MKRCRVKNIFLLTIAALGISAASGHSEEQRAPELVEPSQKEKFFTPDRFSFTESAESSKPVIEPHFSVSHDKRESNLSLGLKQTTERVHGEAGGRLNFLGDISLTTFARIPVYSKETVGSQKTSDGVSSSEILKTPSRLSWRSELGVPVKKGIDLNFFYDNSSFGRVYRSGADEREEKFGTRFIFKFK